MTVYIHVFQNHLCHFNGVPRKVW